MLPPQRQFRQTTSDRCCNLQLLGRWIVIAQCSRSWVIVLLEEISIAVSPVVFYCLFCVATEAEFNSVSAQ